MTRSSHDIISWFDFYYSELKARAFENNELISETNPELISIIKEFFDVQQRIYRTHFSLIINNHTAPLHSTTITMAGYLKGMYSLFSGMELTLNGYYGSARIIFRHVFEFLIISKYSSLTQDERFIKHWEKGGNIGIGKQVLKKIKNKNIDCVNSFWEELCMFNHATSYSQQIGVRNEDIKEQTPGNMAIIIILLNCNYHLLTQHVLHKKVKYYGNEYFGDTIFETKIDAKEIRENTRSFLTPLSQKIIRAYSAKWKIE